MRKACETDLETCVQGVFRRCPSLAGFAVRAGAIELADMTCHPPLDGESIGEMRDYITRELLELVDEQPETALLMSGRTFARTLN
jgi:hypothetical protein